MYKLEYITRVLLKVNTIIRPENNLNFERPLYANID